MCGRRRASWRSRTRCGSRYARDTAMTTRDAAAKHALPLAVVLLIIGLLWYLGCIWLNAPQVVDQLSRTQQPWTMQDLIKGTWSMERPVLPTPDQVASEFWKTTAGTAITSKRNLLYHTWITASATLLGFIIGVFLG